MAEEPTAAGQMSYHVTYMTYHLWWLHIKNNIYLVWIWCYAFLTDLMPQIIYFSKIEITHFKLNFMSLSLSSTCLISLI